MAQENTTLEKMGLENYDVVIVGGAALGSSVACFLKQDMAFRKNGFLILASDSGPAQLKANIAIQNAARVRIKPWLVY